jgi:hypothetical protein
MKHQQSFNIMKRFTIHALAVSAAVSMLLAGSAQAQPCSLMPIALSAQTLAGVAPGTVLTNIWNGSQPGNFGWLSWTGDSGEPTLYVSLLETGDSSTYTNPDNADDHVVNTGDWISGKPGVSNGKHVRAALNALIGVEIVVPVWDEVRGEGDNVAYHVSGFAIVKIISYDLPSKNRITARFVSYTVCNASQDNT